MSFLYSGNPSNSAKDTVRFYIGDTSSKDPLLQDEEIQFLLNMYNDNPLNAAIRCCEMIMAKSARMVDESVGHVKVMYSQRIKQYREMKQDLIKRLSTEDMQPYAGGISKSDKTIDEQNRDLVKPDFSKHMMENNQISPWVTNSYNSWLWFNS